MYSKYGMYRMFSFTLLLLGGALLYVYTSKNKIKSMSGSVLVYMV